MKTKGRWGEYYPRIVLWTVDPHLDICPQESQMVNLGESKLILLAKWHINVVKPLYYKHYHRCSAFGLQSDFVCQMAYQCSRHQLSTHLWMKYWRSKTLSNNMKSLETLTFVAAFSNNIKSAKMSCVNIFLANWSLVSLYNGHRLICYNSWKWEEVMMHIAIWILRLR